MPVSFATATDTGKVRAHNEDACYAEPPVFAVADGMGGAQAGEVASGEAIRSLRGFTLSEDSPGESLAAVVRDANSRIYRLAADDPGLAGMGTTLTAAGLSARSVALAHVGDSRAYLWRGGKLSQLTEDHSLVGEMMRQGRLSALEAETHPQRSIITRALGIEPEVEVDTTLVPWQPGDIFLLCSDGLSSMLPDDEISAVIGDSAGLEEAAAALVDAANTRGGRDNITVVLFSPDDGENGSMAGAASGDEASPAAARPEGSGGSRSRFISWLGTGSGRAAAVVFAVTLLIMGAWLVNHNIYYVGSLSGHLAVFRGVPVEIGPLSFSTTYKVSAVRMDELEPFEQDRIERHDLRSRDSALQVVENYENRDGGREEPAATGVTTHTSTAAGVTGAGGGS
jgi:protein phosphatase